MNSLLACRNYWIKISRRINHPNLIRSMKISKQKLAGLLTEAKNAHHRFVQENNIDEDDEWAEWYAEYIAKHVTNNESYE